MISERHYMAVHIPVCRWGGCTVRVPKEQMDAHEAICQKRSKEQNDRVATHQLRTDPEPAVKINKTFTLDKCCEEVIADLKKKGELPNES